MEQKKFKEMTNEELLEVIKRLEQHHKSLTNILQSTEPFNWPTANWCFEKLTLALYDEDTYEIN